MSIIHKYLIREFLKYFSIVQIIVLCLFIAIDYLTNIDRFLKAELPLMKGLFYVLLKTPHMTVLLTPVGIIISIIIVFGLMNKNKELLALKSSGISVFYLIKPFLVMGVVMSIFLFYIAEEIVPITMTHASNFKRMEIKKKSMVTSKEKNIWIKGKRRITHIKFYNHKLKMVFGVTRNIFDKNFNLIRRIDAAGGVYKEGIWELFDCMEQRFDKITGENTVESYQKKEEVLGFMPEDLEVVQKKSEEMGYRELYAYVEKMESEGYDATIYKVDLYGKIAFPFICILMCIVGAGITIKENVNDELIKNVSVGIGLSFLYWIFYSFCLSLGYGEILPPFIAAWAANFILFCYGIYSLLNAE